MKPKTEVPDARILTWPSMKQCSYIKEDLAFGLWLTYIPAVLSNAADTVPDL